MWYWHGQCVSHWPWQYDAACCRGHWMNLVSCCCCVLRWRMVNMITSTSCYVPSYTSVITGQLTGHLTGSTSSLVVFMAWVRGKAMLCCCETSLMSFGSGHWTRCFQRTVSWTEHGLTSHLTHFRSSGDDVLQVWWLNQQCQSTEGGWLVIQTGLSLTRLISPCYNTTCMQI